MQAVPAGYDRRCDRARRRTHGRGRVDELFDAWEDAWSDKDQDAFRKICSPQLHYEDPLTGEPLEGIPALDHPCRAAVGRLPRRAASSSSARAWPTGRMAAAPCKLLATHREPLGGLPATNQFIVVPVVFYCELDRGRLLRVRAFFDLYDAAVQLGVLPGPRVAGREGAADAARLRPARRGRLTTAMDIAIPIFDQITALDAVGPYEVLSRLPGAQGQLRRQGARARSAPRTGCWRWSPTAR